MNTQVVKPAGAGHETLWVLLTAILVLGVAALFVSARAKPQAVAALASHQVDARTQLNAAEQGLHGDLLVAAEEIVALVEAERVLPPVEQLRSMDLPPFAGGMTSVTRGGHEWRTTAQARYVAYVGRSAAPDVAASFLLRLPVPAATGSSAEAHDHDDEFQVWVHREGPQSAPGQLDDAALARQGWRQVVARYDAGVTRKGAVH